MTVLGHDTPDAESLYLRILGIYFSRLPQNVQKLHGEIGTRIWQGEAEITAGATPLHRIMARVIGFPTRRGTTPITVTFATDEKGEAWTRNFGGQILRTHQSVGIGRNAGLLVERFGVLTVAMDLVLHSNKMWLKPRRWWVLGLPMPKVLLPSGDTFETEEDGKFRFHVDVQVPVLGRLVRYQGWLTRADEVKTG